MRCGHTLKPDGLRLHRLTETMDLLFTAIRAAFYDMPLASIGSVLTDMAREKTLYTHLQENIKWIDHTYSATDAEQITELVRNGWQTSHNGRPIAHILGLLAAYADKTINTGSQPIVHFNQLLRWQRMAVLIGQDCLTVAHMAREDRTPRTAFDWPDTLPTDSKPLNQLFSGILSDTHAHLHASAHVAAINWLCICNYPDLVSRAPGELLKPGQRQVYDLTCPPAAPNLDLLEWTLIAVAIRVALYKRFVLNVADECILQDLRESIGNKDKRVSLNHNVADTISALRCKAPRTHPRFVVDYAVDAAHVGASPYTVLTGERRILYAAFRAMEKGNKEADAWREWLYLYLVVKNKVRREIIATNPLHGFLNFQTYSRRKTPPVISCLPYQRIADRYAVQTAMGLHGKYNMEARVAPDDLTKDTDNPFLPIFNGYAPLPHAGGLTCVVHFLKTGKGSLERRRRDLQNVLAQIPAKAIAGIDAAGPETDCPPVVFAPIYRKALEKGITNRTYHVGEDFHDLLSGIRAVDDAVTLLDLSQGCRLGHALALGLDVVSYYRERHCTLILPQQELLDNLAWLLQRSTMLRVRLSRPLMIDVENEVRRLMRDIGCPAGMTSMDYWNAMRHRAEAHANNITGCILDKGKGTCTFRITPALVNVVGRMQKAVLRYVAQRGITIEACPTSNLRIAPIDRYEQLPLFRFHRPGSRRIAVTINTDDRGIFGTSLSNEFALVAVALTKMRRSNGRRKYTEGQIMEYLRELVATGNRTRFV